AALQKQQLSDFAQRNGHMIRELPCAPSAEFACDFWRWVTDVSASGQPALLSLPELEARQIDALSEVLEASAHPVGVSLQQLPEAAGGASGLLARRDRTAQQHDAPLMSKQDAEKHSRAWVRRALAPSGLALCPYTASDLLAGVKLESVGVDPAPILHSVSSATQTAALIADVWECISQMVAGGEESYSSIVLSAPAFDHRWEVALNSVRG
ncbi:MAG: hypothetical protein SGPRY_001797, partial [Prymnesium sp.]